MIVLFLTAARPMPILKGLSKTRSGRKKGVTEPETEFCRIAVIRREKLVGFGSDAHLITCSRSTSGDHMTDDGNETLYFVNCAWDIYLSKKFVLHMTFTLFKEKL